MNFLWNWQYDGCVPINYPAYLHDTEGTLHSNPFQILPDRQAKVPSALTLAEGGASGDKISTTALPSDSRVIRPLRYNPYLLRGPFHQANNDHAKTLGLPSEALSTMAVHRDEQHGRVFYFD